MFFRCGKLWIRVILLVLPIFFVFSEVSAAEIFIGTSDTWYVLGTAQSAASHQFPFVLGDTDGYTVGDSCQHVWTGENYDYDYAISKYAFRAPFEVTISGIKFSSTSYGYNLLYIACVDPNATEESFTSCIDTPPFRLNLSHGVISIGARWESAGDVCVDAGGAHREYQWCLEGGAGKLTSWKVAFDESGHVKIYNLEDGSMVAEGDAGTCETGWYLIVVRSFDSPISVEEPIYIKSEEIKSITELPLPLGENQGSGECISEAELQEKIEEAYNRGYQAGIEFCRQHPAECGVEEPSVGDNCAYYDLINNELVVPCFTIGTDWYELKFSIVNTQGNIMLRLSGYEKK